MEITRDELLSIAYDPTLIQKKILDLVENATNGEVVISDPTSPFVMLLEAAAVTAANSNIESRTVIRKSYPNLALTAGDLYHHITDDELANMFAVPSEAIIAFYINVLDLRANGYRPLGANYVETTIPVGTEIRILNVPLTILNDIVVRLYDNGSVFVEQQYNSLDIAINDLGILPSGIMSDPQQASWITFSTRVKQVQRTVVNVTANASQGFSQNVDISDSYCYANVSYKNGTTAGEYKSIAKAHHDEYIDSSVPTVYINIAGNVAEFTIPDMYLLSNMISGNVKIELYETKGKLYLPINKYTFQDFTVYLGDVASSPSAASCGNVSLLINSYNIIEGGSSGMSVNSLRDSIIYNTTGDIDLPITTYQLIRSGDMNGYDIYKALDVITERLYIASKNLPKVPSNLILASQDVFFNTTKILLSDVRDHYNINVVDDNFIIKSGTVFKEVNGIVSIVDKYELDMVNTMDSVAKIAYFKTNKYFYTPYYYLIKLEDGYTTSDIYDLDKPYLDNLRIVAKNNNITQRVNIDKYTMLKTTDGYDIIFTLISNTEFNNIDRSKIGVQLKLPMKDDTVSVALEASYDQTTNYYTVHIISNLNIDNDGYMDVQNGTAGTTNKYVNLNAVGTMYVYTTDTYINDSSNYLLEELTQANGVSYTVFSKEKISISFGNKVEYIWNKLYNTYTERKYKTYEFDVPMSYDKDNYKVDDRTGSIYRCILNENNETELITTLSHRKGDPVKVDGVQVYKYKKGDIVLNSRNEPIIDTYSGICRYVDILMLEYEFKLSNSVSYKNYNDMSLDTLRHYLQEDLPALNNKLLDNSKIVFKGYKSAVPVVVSINNIYYSLPYLVTPTVNLYISSSVTLTNEEIDGYKDTIGGILDTFLNLETISLTNIKNEIMRVLGTNVVGAKITGIDPTNSEILTIKEKTNRLVLNKVLALNKYNEIITKYDLVVTVQYI